MNFITIATSDIILEKLLTQGKSDGEIAAALDCSLSTVKHYVSSLREKTGISSRVELAVRGKSTGLIDFSREKAFTNSNNHTFV